MQINVRYCKLGGLLFLALATIATVKKADENAAEHQARAQVVGQVEPLCRALFPDRDVLRFQVVPTSITQQNRVRDDLWLVECLDKNSNEIAQVVWNVDTQRVLRVEPAPFSTSLRQKHSPPPLQRLVDEKQAVAIARAWTARLRPVSGAVLQQSGYRTRRNSTSWTVRLRLPESVAFLRINAQSGELESALMQESPPSVIPGVNMRP